MTGLKNLTAGVRHIFKESSEFPRKPVCSPVTDVRSQELKYNFPKERLGLDFCMILHAGAPILSQVEEV